ncbi:MAG: histidinol-phosphate transaminase [Bacteroidales bacterium]|nr:histidinol-phosphate transaminase [Bacteroidales bacterium]
MGIIERLIRKNIAELTPYSSAREEYSGDAAVFLDANENPFDSGFNRYPDPLQLKLKVKLSQLKNLNYEKIFIGNGSDEPIDLLMRVFCEPGTDNIVSIKPTYGMYKVCADINNIEFRECLLTKEYQLDKKTIFKSIDADTKLLFLCSPNNPTSNSFFREDIIYILEQFEGLVILDEAYIDFSGQRSFLYLLNNYPNLVILQTLSKAWGMAGIRMGMAFASREIIGVLNKIKYPYNVNILTQRKAIDHLNNEEEKNTWVSFILGQREYLRVLLNEFDFITEILPSDANFLMIRVKEPKKLLTYLLNKKIIVRDRSKVPLCEGCLRITVGTKEENNALIKALKDFNKGID